MIPLAKEKLVMNMRFASDPCIFDQTLSPPILTIHLWRTDGTPERELSHRGSTQGGLLATPRGIMVGDKLS